MNRPDFVSFMGSLGPVAEAIARYDASRPLNSRGRDLQGLLGSLNILRTEGTELAAALQTDNIHDIREEAGDVMFGLADYWRRRGGHELSRGEFLMLGGWVQLLMHTERAHGVDLIAAGIHVNGDKNPKNNPEWAYQHCHPLDRPSKIIENNDIVRRGLRALRGMHPERKLTVDNVERGLQFWGYTTDILDDTSLAFAFLTKVARDGVKL